MSDPTPRPSARARARRRRVVIGGVSRRRWVRAGLIFVGVALALNGLIGDRGLMKGMNVRREHDRLAASIGALKRENARIAEEIRRLRNDPKAIEDAAREDLGLARPDELVFVVRDAPSAKKAPRGAPPASR